MSQARIFGQQVRISFSNSDGGREQVAEIDDFSAKDDDMVKENASLGEFGKGEVTVISNGGTLSFSAKAANAKLIAMMIAQQKQHKGNNYGKRGKTPYIEVRQVVTFPDDSSYEVIYKGVVLHSYETAVTGNKEEVTEKFEGVFKEKALFVYGEEATAYANEGVNFIFNAINNLVSLAANANTVQIESKIENYLSGSSAENLS